MEAMLETREKLVTACRILEQAGVFDDFGHFSVRCGDGYQILMSPAVAPAKMTAEDLLLFDLNAPQLTDDRRIERDAVLHFAIYQKRPDVMAVAHAHSPMVVTLSIAGIKLKIMENTGSLVFPPDVPLYDRYGPVTDLERANDIADALGPGNIVVLRGHGDVVAGASIEETCMTALYTERCAHFQYRTVLIGGAFPFPENSREEMQQDLLRGKTLKRSWGYFAGMAKRDREADVADSLLLGPLDKRISKREHNCSATMESVSCPVSGRTSKSERRSGGR